MNPAELTTLGQSAEREAEALMRDVDRLERTPVTVADLLRGRVQAGVDFRHFDTVARELDAASRTRGEHRFDGANGTHTLAGVRSLLADALAAGAPHREAGERERRGVPAGD